MIAYEVKIVKLIRFAYWKLQSGNDEVSSSMERVVSSCLHIGFCSNRRADLNPEHSRSRSAYGNGLMSWRLEALQKLYDLLPHAITAFLTLKFKINSESFINTIMYYAEIQ